MTTKVTIHNHGSKTLKVSGGLLQTGLEIRPDKHAEVWLTDSPALQIEETSGVSANLAGGPGEDHP